MFIARRTYRDRTGLVLAGSIVEASSLRPFVRRLQEGSVVEVTEHNYSHYKALFKDKYGIVLPALPEKVATSVEVKQPKAVATAVASVVATTQE